MATQGRWLLQATEQNLLTRLDTGRHHHPDRYWLAGKKSDRGLPPLDVLP